MTRVSATDYRDIAQVEDPRVSPDGDRVAFVRKVPTDDESYEQTVYLVPTDGKGEARRFTVSEGVDSQPRWSPSGDRLAFVSTRGADDDRPQLWVLPVAGGEAERVTDVPGGVGNVAWSPDGSKIAFQQSTTAEEREEGLDTDLGDEEYEREAPDPRVVDRLVYRQHGRYKDGAEPHVYVVHLDEAGDGGGAEADAGENANADAPRVERLTDGEYGHVSPAWGDSETLYFGVKRQQGDTEPDDSAVIDIVAHDLSTGETEDVTRTTAWGLVLDATADGRLAFGRTPEEQISMRQSDVVVYDREADEEYVPTENLDRDIALQGGLSWGPNEERVYFLTPDEGDYVARRVPGDASGEPDVLVGEGHATAVSVGGPADDPVVAVAKSEWDHRGDVFCLREGEERRLTNVNADYLEGVDVQEPEEIRFESDDGVELQGWVLTPPEFDPEETYPLAVEVHGGPHAMWSPTGTMWHEFQLLAARGYVVFWSNPRGSTGYGEEFATAIERNWGEVTMTDVMAGVELVCERDYVDEENAFLTGGSFGGFMTGWMVGETDFFRGAVAQRGVYDLSSFYGSTDAFKLIEGDFDTTPWDEPEFLWEQSPVARAADVSTPTLVMHAENDFRVPVNNGEMFYLFLRKNGVETRLVRYPREGHELSRSGEPAHVVDRLERTVRWFDGYSDHHDAPKALERGDDGLSAAENDEDGSGEDDGDD
ncbi:S9 family peptidase [Halopelagius longus]|uniref:Dipeptidyl aminopeptidase/acylaminoacyl peptidase n=1 Tax=Halopelagius longus TaxID=1236180 RepID=A0A1H1ETJ2_9EURY|nr:S9 family peptidase [Halopelagius longus]RDI71885.1 S9 family peptidase [Halopelagius longus]SDQ92061.1 Dipeptidyl aminopeptidase/acylaminoacyl peptidase [Halopelagius longus]